MVEAMGTGFSQGTATMDGPISIHDKMIADSVEAPRLMAAVNLLYGEVLPFYGGRTMDDYFVDCSHDDIIL